MEALLAESIWYQSLFRFIVYEKQEYKVEKILNLLKEEMIKYFSCEVHIIKLIEEVFKSPLCHIFIIKYSLI